MKGQQLGPSMHIVGDLVNILWTILAVFGGSLLFALALGRVMRDR